MTILDDAAIAQIARRSARSVPDAIAKIGGTPRQQRAIEAAYQHLLRANMHDEQAHLTLENGGFPAEIVDQVIKQIRSQL